MLTKEQLIERKSGIGGSDASGVCGVSKWKTPVQIYLDKISDVTEQEENKLFERGNILEPLVRDKFSRMMSKDVSIKEKTLRCIDNTFMLANIDGYIASEEAILEVKTASYFSKSEWGETSSDQIPSEYFLQVQHYMSVCGVEKAYVAVLFADEKMFDVLTTLVKKFGVKDLLDDFPLDIRVYEIFRHDTLSKRLVKIEKSFWFDNVQKRKAPQWECIDDIKMLFPKAEEGKKIVAPAEAFDIINQRREAGEMLKQLSAPYEKKIEQLDAKIISLFGDAEELIDCEGKRVASWKNSVRNLFDSAKFKIEMPALYPQFIKQSESRRLTF